MSEEAYLILSDSSVCSSGVHRSQRFLFLLTLGFSSPLQIINKSRPITSGNLEFQKRRHLPFLKPPT